MSAARRRSAVILPPAVTSDDVVAAVVALDMAVPWLAHYPHLEEKAITARGMRALRERLTGGRHAAR